jgi:hypothetical protein
VTPARVNVTTVFRRRQQAHKVSRHSTQQTVSGKCSNPDVPGKKNSFFRLKTDYVSRNCLRGGVVLRASTVGRGSQKSEIPANNKILKLFLAPLGITVTYAQNYKARQMRAFKSVRVNI